MLACTSVLKYRAAYVAALIIDFNQPCWIQWPTTKMFIKRRRFSARSVRKCAAVLHTANEGTKEGDVE